MYEPRFQSEMRRRFLRKRRVSNEVLNSSGQLAFYTSFDTTRSLQSRAGKQVQRSAAECVSDTLIVFSSFIVLVGIQPTATVDLTEVAC